MPKLDPRLRTLNNCIVSVHDRWDRNNTNDAMLSDIEVDLETALAELRQYFREENERRRVAAGDPSPMLIRAAKAQWAREAQERNEEMAREQEAADRSRRAAREAEEKAREERAYCTCSMTGEHVWVTDEYNIDACAKCGEERGENR